VEVLNERWYGNIDSVKSSTTLSLPWSLLLRWPLTWMLPGFVSFTPLADQRMREVTRPHA
jgi:hypothetical protein